MDAATYEDSAAVLFQDVVPGTEVGVLEALEEGVPFVRTAAGVARALVLAGRLTSADVGARVLLVRPGGLAQPVVLGVVAERVVEEPAAAPPTPRAVRLEAERELELTCGRSSLSMRRDGKIVLRGVEIVSRASRANKVKGGTVRIN